MHYCDLLSIWSFRHCDLVTLILWFIQILLISNSVHCGLSDFVNFKFCALWFLQILLISNSVHCGLSDLLISNSVHCGLSDFVNFKFCTLWFIQIC